MKGLPFAACVLGAAFVSAGCVAHRSGGSAWNDVRWSEGVTTRCDVVAMWGNPDRIEGDVWVWREGRRIGGKIKASYYGIGLSVSRMNVATCEYRLEFDGKGRLVYADTAHSVPGGASWSIIPFDW